MYKAYFRKYTFKFDKPASTSRGVMTDKTSWFIFLTEDKNPGITGIGECGPLFGLSIDDQPSFEKNLTEVCENIEKYLARSAHLENYPSIRFGLEMALIDLKQGGKRILFPSFFTEFKDSISINGLIWMGPFEAMKMEIRKKLEAGFSCIKLKIGAIDFEDEIKLIRIIRKEYSADEIEIRVDANGSFKAKEALERLNRLSTFCLHSIEQPIKQNQWPAMAELCQKSPVPVALDEELIGINTTDSKQKLLEQINPQYIVLKPSLLGGFKASEEWIELAERKKIRWWITSALESNIGLNAIAQWAYTFRNKQYQGLGTGQLFRNNIRSSLKINRGRLFHDPDIKWNVKSLEK